MEKNEIAIFETSDEQVKLSVNISDDTVWLNENPNPPAMLGRME